MYSRPPSLAAGGVAPPHLPGAAALLCSGQTVAGGRKWGGEKERKRASHQQAETRTGEHVGVPKVFDTKICAAWSVFISADHVVVGSYLAAHLKRGSAVDDVVGCHAPSAAQPEILFPECPLTCWTSTVFKLTRNLVSDSRSPTSAAKRRHLPPFAPPPCSLYHMWAARQIW